MNGYGGKASDFAQVERSAQKAMRGSVSREKRTSAKLKRFSGWALFWFGLMWMSWLVPVVWALLSR